MSRTGDAPRVAALLLEAREVARWNHRLQSNLAPGTPRQEMWSAVIGHIDNTLNRLDDRHAAD